MKKRVLSIFLCLCVILSLLPMVALGIEKPSGVIVKTAKTEADIPSDFVGQVVTIKNMTDETNGEYYALTVGLHNTPASNGFALRLQYNTLVVDFCDKTGAVKDEMDEPVLPSVNTVYWEKYQSNMLADSLTEGQMNTMLGKDPTDGAYGFMQALKVTEVTGKLQLDALVMVEIPSGASKFVLGTGADPASYTSPVDSTAHLYTIYFKEKAGQTLAADTFTLYADSSTDNGGAKTMLGADATSYGACFVGFPESTPPVPTTYPVKVIVGPTAAEESAALAETNNNWLTAPNIKIWKADGDNGNILMTDGYPRAFTSTPDAKGLLISGDKVVEEDGTAGSGVLKLESGWYKYEVTPTGQTSVYAVDTGYFQVDAAGDQTVQKRYIHAKAAGAAEAKDFTLSLLDGESADRQSAFESGTVKVTLGGANQGEKTITNGKITLTTVPSDASKTLTLEKDGYVTRTLSDAVFSTTNDSIIGTGITDNSLVLVQKRSDITLTAPTAPAYFTVSAKPGGTVTPNMAANELPITVAATGAENTATVSLPDGEYVYTMVTPGNEDLSRELTVAANGVDPKITVSESGGTSQTLALNTKGDGTGHTATADAPTTGAPTAITDPMYQVVGEWTKTDGRVTGMTVKVYLKNIMATQGSFGLRYDPAVFTLNAAGFTPSGNISVPADEKLHPGEFEVEIDNPTMDSGYHAFRWNATGHEGEVTAVDGRTDAALIATYELGLTAKAANGGYEKMMHDKSLYVQPYVKTASAVKIKEVFDKAGEVELYHKFMDELWRPLGLSNAAPDPGTARLTADKAAMGGFHQVTNALSEDVDTWDVLSQFVFDNTTGRSAIAFSVTEADKGDAVKDAAVSLKQGDSEVGSGKTDAFGDVMIPVSGEGSYSYTISAEGYRPADGTVSEADLSKTVSVKLNLSDMHKVRIHDDQTVSTALIGSGAQNGVDYFFMLAPQPGYAWPDDKLPAPGELEIRQVAKDGIYDGGKVISTDKLTWDKTRNQYKLAGDAITGLSTDDLVVKVADGKTPVQATADNNYTVTVTAGTGGKFSYEDVLPASTFAPNAPATDLNKVVETLGTGESTSAKYTIKGDGPTDGSVTPDEATEPYQSMVIDKFLVNGTQMTLTDYERIHGMTDYQLVAVTSDQTITVTFCEATVDPGEPGNPNDDIIVDDPTHPVTPANEAAVTLILSDYGSAAVSGTNPTVTDDSITGPGSKTYILDAVSGSLTAVFAGTQNVNAPDGSSVNYVVDKVLVNGVEPASGWESNSGTLTLSDLAAGTSHTVIVTFKPADGTSIYASLELVRYAGDGTATPVGSSVWPLGLPATIRLDPNAGWQLGAVDLTEPTDSDPADVTEQVVKADDASYSYTTPNLTEGVTTVGYAFKEHSYQVEVLMNYAMRGNAASIRPQTAATFTFTRTSGMPLTITYGPDEAGSCRLDKPNGKESGLRFELPLGTWDLTVSKHGYLDYTVTGFVIAMDGNTLTAGSAGDMTTVVATTGTDPLIHFGRTGSEIRSRSVAPIIGDSTWDGKLIAANDIGQVANGMTKSASSAQKARADIDESIAGNYNTTVTAEDMSYVVDNYGAVRTVLTYSEFMALSVSGA